MEAASIPAGTPASQRIKQAIGTYGLIAVLLILPVVFAIKIANLINAFFDQLDDLVIFIFAQSHCAARANPHHQKLRTKLLQRPGQFLRFRVMLHKVKCLHVPFRVANDSFVIFQLKKADVTMVILNRFLLEFRAVLWFQ